MPILKKKPRFEKIKDALGIKRESGTTRVYDPARKKISTVSGVNKGPLTVTGSKNPKVRQVEKMSISNDAKYTRLLNEEKRLTNLLAKLEKKDPRSQMDARKRESDLLKLKERILKLSNLKEERIKKFSTFKKNILSVIKEERVTDRSRRQAKLIVSKLYSILTPEHKKELKKHFISRRTSLPKKLSEFDTFAIDGYLKLMRLKINPTKTISSHNQFNLLLKTYRDFLSKTGKNFSAVTGEKAITSKEALELLKSGI